MSTIVNPEVVIAEDKKSAVVQFPKEHFSDFIGEELKKAHDTIMSKADEYVQNVTSVGYTKAGELFAENEEMNTVDVEAPIFRDGDRFQAHIKREEIELVEKDDYVPAMKITQSITSTANVQSGVRTMASAYRDLIASKNK